MGKSAGPTHSRAGGDVCDSAGGGGRRAPVWHARADGGGGLRHVEGARVTASVAKRGAVGHQRLLLPQGQGLFRDDARDCRVHVPAHRRGGDCVLLLLGAGGPPVLPPLQEWLAHPQEGAARARGGGQCEHARGGEGVRAQGGERQGPQGCRHDDLQCHLRRFGGVKKRACSNTFSLEMGCAPELSSGRCDI
eukprot:1121427-Pyramimonas_sp.AAC.2